MNPNSKILKPTFFKKNHRFLKSTYFSFSNKWFKWTCKFK